MPDKKAVTRRRLLKSAASAVAAPYIVSSSALGLGGAVAPSNRIAMGFVGVGEHGRERNLKGFLGQKDAHVVAVCDVDSDLMRTARGLVEKTYAEGGKGTYEGCAVHRDFRDLIVRKDLDAIMVSTPDHWHVIPALMAVKAGKDVICEKPLTLTVSEGRILSDAVKLHRRIFQTSSENRSLGYYLRMAELVRNGRIGMLKRIHVELPAGHRIHGATDRNEQPPPESLDYDMWLGQAPKAPYCPARCHWNFRWNLDYSGGHLTDWGAHLIDIAQWGNNSDRTGPLEVEGKGEFPPKSDLYNTATKFECRYAYQNGVELIVSSRSPGIRFEGSDGWIGNDGWDAPLQASDEKILQSRLGPGDTRLYTCSGGEHRNFLDCVKSRQECYAPAEVGHRTITIAHIGNISMMLNRKLRWDPAREQFPGDDEANRMLKRNQREPWTIANVDGWLKERA